METNTTPALEISYTRRNLAALSYAWILSIPVLLTGRNDPFVGSHARQGTLLFVFSIIAWFIPYAGYVIEILLGITMIVGYLRASQGHSFSLPVSTDGISALLARGKTQWQHLWGSGPVPSPDTATSNSTEHENQLSACAYLSIVSVVIMDNGGDSAAVRFHARQGVVIFLLSIIAGALGMPGQHLLILLLIASVAGFLSALLGRATRLPLIHTASLRLPSLDTAWRSVKAWCLRILGTELSVVEPPLQTTTDDRDKSLGMLAYFLLGPVFLLSPNASAFVLFHARQGLLLNAGLIGLYAAFPTAYSAFAIVLALTVLGASRAHRGTRSPLPAVAELVGAVIWAFTLTKRHANIPELPSRPEPTGNETGLHDASLHHG